MRYFVATVVLLGLVLGIYLHKSSEQDIFGARNPENKQLAAQNTDQLDVVADKLDADDPSLSIKETSPVSIPINWRQRTTSGLHWKEYPTKTYDELRALAESGDGQAAAFLADRLSNCRHLPPPQSSAEIDAAVEEMRRTHMVPRYWNGVETMMDFNNSLESLDDQVELYQTRARRCSTVTTEQRAEWQDWVDRAIAMGSTDLLSHNLLYDSMEKDDYMQLISDLWDAGEPTALFSLAGVDAIAAWQDHDVSRNVRSYAYERAILTLLRDYYEAFDIPHEENAFVGLETDLANQRQHMHAYEIREAERLAKEIIEKNRNCCLTWPGYIVDFE